jgi:methanogenic corrinoid protein MtbC1
VASFESDQQYSSPRLQVRIFYINMVFRESAPPISIPIKKHFTVLAGEFILNPFSECVWLNAKYLCSKLGRHSMEKIVEIQKMIEESDPESITQAISDALADGIVAKDILEAMISSMGVVGDKFSEGELFIPEMLMAAKAMTTGVEVLKPLLVSDGLSGLGTCIIGTVEGDLHDIGKNLVAMMIESAGFTIVNLGVDVPTSKWLEAISEHKDVKLIACSALLTTTMPALQETINAIKSSGMSGFRIIVGGASLTQHYADTIGADGFAEDAGGAATKALELVQLS